MFVQFIKKIKLSKLDNNTIMTGILTPPAAMAAKIAGEFVPQLSFIKAIPDVVFVPAVTMAALVVSKLSRRIYRRRVQFQPGRSSSFNGDKTKDLEPVAEVITPPCPPN